MVDSSAIRQAIDDCFNAPVPPTIENLAAAILRAAADQVVPKDVDPSGDWTDKDEVREQLLAIAAELEGTDG